jgi:hypothetical protein
VSRVDRQRHRLRRITSASSDVAVSESIDRHRQGRITSASSEVAVSEVDRQRGRQGRSMSVASREFCFEAYGVRIG